MDQSRYRDRAYLVTYELTTDIFDAYDIQVDDIVPIRSVYILYTDKGVKILKKINYSLEELEFINNVVDHAGKNYPFIVSFMKTVSGKYYIKKDEGIYVVLNLIEGREADFQNPVDISMISKALCKLHYATSNIDGVIMGKDNLFNWIPDFKKRADELVKFREISELHHIKSSFDKLFLEYIDRYYEEALHAIELLQASSYNKLCSEGSHVKSICHHDLAYHNIMIDNNSNVHFVDFDYCIFDLRIHDIANFIVKSVKYCNWDIDKAVTILENYRSIDQISKEELKALYGFLMFPQDFYEISRQYYMKTKNWDEGDFLSRLERKTGYYSDRKQFLHDLNEYIKMRG